MAGCNSTNNVTNNAQKRSTIKFRQILKITYVAHLAAITVKYHAFQYQVGLMQRRSYHNQSIVRINTAFYSALF